MKLRRHRPATAATRSFWAVWLFAAFMLLKAAMPMLATESARAQGKALVEVCTVYGMSMVSVEAGKSGASAGQDAPRTDDLPTHLDHQCPLTALAALGSAGDPPLFLAATGRAGHLPSVGRTADPGHDAAADWVARRKQGPPRDS